MFYKLTNKAATNTNKAATKIPGIAFLSARFPALFLFKSYKYHMDQYENMGFFTFGIEIHLKFWEF
jgi:Na+/H+-translocating membrane pyrophosphatase